MNPEILPKKKKGTTHMKKTFTNAEIITIIKSLNNKDSFITNPSIKPPFEILWANKINLKLLGERFDLIAELEKEIYQECMKPEYLEAETNEDGKEVQKIKPECTEALLSDVNNRLQGLSSQTNELEIQTFSEATLIDFMKKYDEQISSPEFAALEYFTTPTETL